MDEFFEDLKKQGIYCVSENRKLERSKEMMKKGEALGADAQISKPEIGKLVRIMDGLLLK